MNARKLWSRILIIVGSIAMLVGALDPLEGSLVILPGTGHFLHLERPEEVNQRIVAFLQSA